MNTVRKSTLQIEIGTDKITATLADNASVNAFVRLMENGPLEIALSNNGGFEQVGALGRRLPSRDKQTTTSAGDIMLYASSYVVLFYGSNTWAYTPLGKINGLSAAELRRILGKGRITATFSLA